MTDFFASLIELLNDRIMFLSEAGFTLLTSSSAWLNVIFALNSEVARIDDKSIFSYDFLNKKFGYFNLKI